MQLNTLHLLSIFLLVCLLATCKGDDDISGPIQLSNSAGTCDSEIEDFLLSQENLELISYQTFSNVSFINAEGMETTFQISQPRRTVDEGIFEDADSTKYCFATESFETTLSNEDGLIFNILIESKPYFPELTLAYGADVLKLFYNNTSDPGTARRLVFRKVLDIKDYPSPLYQTTELIASQYFIDTEFKNIEKTNFNTPIIELYYSDDIGIVAYLDENNILWQFNSKN